MTAVMVPSRPDVHNYLLKAGREQEGRKGFFNQGVIDTMQENDILVVDMCDQILYGTYVGGNLSTAIKARTKNGGAVIWGGIRDLEQIVDIADFQAYYRGIHPSPIGDVMMTGMNVPTRIGSAVCLRDAFGFERLATNTYTTAQIDQEWWPDFIRRIFVPTSAVYFTDLRVGLGTNLLEKLTRLMRAAGIENIDMEKKFVAIKIHFGEPGNLSYLRPNYAKAVVDQVKRQGGLPFLTDCNTLYVGRRKHALEHLDAAYENGFSPFSTGCQIIIADGLKGTDEIEVPVAGGQYIKTAKIGRAIMDADVFISLSHFKGHECTGFGGAIKNIGMGCGRCLGRCNFDAIHNQNDSANEDLNRKMAEYAKAVVDHRPQFHISLVMDISPYCDCHAENDLPILPDIGMFASVDPVALDQACVDACNAAQPVPGSLLDERIHAPGFCDCGDHFVNTTPESCWQAALEHAEKIGLGSRQYELNIVK